MLDDWGGEDTYDVIGDSGAGAAIGSIEALQAQGAHPDQLGKLVQALPNPVRFSTATGIVPSTTGIDVTTQGNSSTTMHLLKNCPLAISVGEEVSKGYAFIWSPSLFSKPFFANAKYVKVSCPKSRRYEAEYVKDNVPHFSIKLDHRAPKGPPAGASSDSRRGGSRFYPRKRGQRRPLTSELK